MSKKAWSPGRRSRSANVCGCGLQRSPGDGVDRLDVLGAELEERPHRLRDDLVLGHSGPQHAVDLVVDGIDDPGGLVEQGELVVRLDLARLEHDGLSVVEGQPPALQGHVGRHVGHVEPELLALEAALAQLLEDQRRRDRPGSPSRRPSHRASAAPTPASSPAAATGSTAGGGAPPSRSPRGSGPRPAAAARSGCSCRAPTSRSPCSSRSAGCSGRRAGAPPDRRPRAPPWHGPSGACACGRSRRAAPSRRPSRPRATQCSPLSPPAARVQRFCTWTDCASNTPPGREAPNGPPRVSSRRPGWGDSRGTCARGRSGP